MAHCHKTETVLSAATTASVTAFSKAALVLTKVIISVM